MASARSRARGAGHPDVSARPPMHLHTTLWGAAYIKVFVETVMPTWLSPGNLGGLPARAHDAVHLFTSAEARAAIEAAPAFATLSRDWPVRFHAIDDEIGTVDAYTLLSRTHERAMAMARPVEASIWYLMPDVVFCDGAFCAAAGELAAGRRGVVTATVRTRRESVVSAVDAAAPPDPQGARTLSPRAGVALMLAHLHPVSLSLMWDVDVANHWPSHLYFPVGDRGLLVHGHHLHPLTLWPDNWDALLELDTVDGRFMEEAIRDPASIVVIDNSDRLMGFEISGAEEARGEVNVPREQREQSLIAFRAASATSLHKRFFKTPVRLHTGIGPIDRMRWWRVMRNARRNVVDAVGVNLEARRLRAERRARPTPWNRLTQRWRNVGTLRMLGVRSRLRRILGSARPGMSAGAERSR